jgi:Rad3-related DNA helicase
MRDTSAMQEGSRLHRKLQKGMKTAYQSEVPLSITVPVCRDGCSFSLTIEGRADGIIKKESAESAFLPDPFGISLPERAFSHADFQGIQTSMEDFLDISDSPDSPQDEPDLKNPMLRSKEAKEPEIVIDEIKGVYRHLKSFSKPIPIHRYQALCYASIYAQEHSLSVIGIQLTYCSLSTEEVRRFHEIIDAEKLNAWFFRLIDEYAKWLVWQKQWVEKRNQSLKGMPFPFPYRTGQKEFAEGVYSAIYHKKKLYLQAPTGTGKTMSTLYPSVMSLSTGLCERIFYLTAKTITRTVAEEAVSILLAKGASLKTLTITAKEKLCPNEPSPYHQLPCNPVSCPRAKGHFDRVNDAVFALLSSDEAITRDVILAFAGEYQVCPFEMALDTALFCDIIICDYNYLFDPNIYLKRFFSNEKPSDYVFLIDEAHNLVDRARDMYSAVLYKEEFLSAVPYVLGYESRIPGRLQSCDRAFLLLKKECDGFTVLSDIQEAHLRVMELFDDLEPFLQEHLYFEHRDALLELYFHIRHFLNIYDLHTKKYRIYGDYEENGNFFISLRCMDPSDPIGTCLMRGRSSVLFSATLLPMSYYQEQLAGTKQDYAMYLPSPFPKEHSRILIAGDVSTRYTMRIDEEFQKIASYIMTVYESHAGNYMVFFPSYQMMETLLSYLKELRPDIRFLCQKPGMSEREREEFLNCFQENPVEPVLALGIMGGIFSEGIDLKYSRLIGTILVGPGLPMVCKERELYRTYFDENGKNGFDYAYLYPGLNKVFQAAGRVIRTDRDRGVIVLLDDRFLTAKYRELFPVEWEPEAVTNRTLSERLRDFW